MKIAEIIVEMPIEDIRTYGDMGTEGSFRKSDLGIINSQKGRDKIQRILFNIPVPVILHIINHPLPIRGTEQTSRHLSFNTPTTRPDRYQKIGWMTPESVRKVYGFDLRIEPNALNLVYVENEGTNRVPLTPWIIAHRMKHTFDFISSDQKMMATPQVPDARHIEYEFLRWIGYQTGLHGETTASRDSLKLLLQQMINTRSAREGTFNAAGEFFPECFALFCVRGHIGLQAPAEYPQMAAELPAWEQKLVTAYQAMLQWAVGKVLTL